MRLRFCQSSDVQKKRNVYFKFKGKFLGHINTLKKKGINLSVMHCIDEWIDDNIDELTNTFKKTDFVTGIKKTKAAEDS